MTEFIEKYHLLKETQSGYLEGPSTNTVALKLIFSGRSIKVIVP